MGADSPPRLLFSEEGKSGHTCGSCLEGSTWNLHQPPHRRQQASKHKHTGGCGAARWRCGGAAGGREGVEQPWLTASLFHYTFFCLFVLFLLYFFCLSVCAELRNAPLNPLLPPPALAWLLPLQSQYPPSPHTPPFFLLPAPITSTLLPEHSGPLPPTVSWSSFLPMTLGSCMCVGACVCVHVKTFRRTRCLCGY